MSDRPARTISGLLHFARLAIVNTLSDPEIQTLVTEYGYSAERMQEGKLRLDHAQEAANLRESSFGSQQVITVEKQTRRTKARDAYQALAGVLRAVFVNDPEQLTRFELRGRTPTRDAAFLKRAYTLFDNALQLPETQELLARYRYDQTRLRAGRQLIMDFDQALQSQRASIGAAQQSTREQDDALDVLRDWYTQYIKIARIALRDKKELLEKIGIPYRTTPTKAQRAARQRATKKAPTIPEPFA